MAEALNEFVSTLVGGIRGIGLGIGSGANEFIQELFLTVENGQVTGLSTFGGVIALFGGVGLAVGLTTLIFNWVRSIGN